MPGFRQQPEKIVRFEAYADFKQKNTGFVDLASFLGVVQPRTRGASYPVQ
jgi:hypothetical protein